VQQTNDDAGYGRTGALEALLDVAHELENLGDYKTVSAAFEPDDYEQIIALAWRYQFSDDRSRFKREVREMEEHVRQRMIAKLEQPR
jgi:hypothetical protein